MSKRESLVYGRRACLAVAQKRPRSLLRVYYTRKGRTELGPLLKACAAQRRPYREVEESELEKLSKSTHHEGVVVFCRRAKARSLRGRLEDGPLRGIWFALDGVANDHNLGAIARTIAWFGNGGIIWEGMRSELSGAALRISQGGAEHIELFAVPDLPEALELLIDQGITLIGADQDATHSLFDTQIPSKHCWLLGNEQFGLSEICANLTQQRIRVPGSGQIESLNVSVTAGILAAESARNR